ncbi:CLIP domain-containing serine protease B4 [Microplitis demolitor]|uniref:CLIP domain-containing serine protease B4 n=1 Tax=Microplitis demolitor TaxID=69319 RepID=UPI00235B66A0|nr:CLIP domain-containing serine protease B4 [Microplitis demolitor]XP_053597413.1 CLIP domain-containing serine protease B4 [Microplitis demolitor]
MKLLLTLFSQLLIVVYAQDNCRTPSGQISTCILVTECPPLMSILKGPRPIPYEQLELLRSSQCGFEGKLPKVCCETEQPVQLSTTEEPKLLVIPEPPDVSNHSNLKLFNHSICGPITAPKIFGGNKTGVLDFPWMALIAYNINGRKEFRCGGTIINKRYILTAAHCVTSLPPSLFLLGVRVGDHDLNTERDCDRDEDGLEIVCADQYQDFLIETVHFYPDYVPSKLQNDVGLIRLNSDIDFTPINVKPICLPIGTAQRLGQKTVTVTGWGATEYGTRSTELLMVNLSPVPTDECAKAYEGKSVIWYKQLCAGGKNGKDSCLGDSGGPLQSPGHYYNDVRYIQYGIVSYGPRSCGINGFPGVYTNIPYYMDWILDSLRD